MKTKFTTAEIAAGDWRDCEFVDLPGLERGWSIKRGFAYQLIASGQIRSVVLRRKGRIRGKRLIEVESVRRFLASAPIDPDAKFSRQVRAANKLSIAARRQNKASAKLT